MMIQSQVFALLFSCCLTAMGLSFQIGQRSGSSNSPTTNCELKKQPQHIEKLFEEVAIKPQQDDHTQSSTPWAALAAPALIVLMSLGTMPDVSVAKEPQLDLPSADEYWLRTGKQAPPNPLTNPILEKIRIKQQQFEDNSMYGGELAINDLQAQSSGGKLVAPILSICRTVDAFQALSAAGPAEWEEALGVLSRPPFTKVEFKKTFNAYSDNIYYSNPDRANVYLAGGAEPTTMQSLAYLYRNEALTNVEYLREELQYMLKESKLPDGDRDTSDVRDYARRAKAQLDKYLAIVPPADLAAARALLDGGAAAPPPPPSSSS